MDNESLFRFLGKGVHSLIQTASRADCFWKGWEPLS